MGKETGLGKWLGEVWNFQQFVEVVFFCDSWFSCSNRGEKGQKATIQLEGIFCLGIKMERESALYLIHARGGGGKEQELFSLNDGHPIKSYKVNFFLIIYVILIYFRKCRKYGKAQGSYPESYHLQATMGRILIYILLVICKHIHHKHRFSFVPY